MIRKQYALYAAFVCFILLFVLIFIVGMRTGLHDGQAVAEANAEEVISRTVEEYESQISDLEAELAEEKKIDRIVVSYEYLPLPVDYENIGSLMPDESDAVLIAKTMWGEYRNAENYNQCASVAWCVLNRLDVGTFGNSVKEIVTAPHQFDGYSASNPVDARLYQIADEVLARWALEKTAANSDVGRTIPSDYLWMQGNGYVNTYRNAYSGGNQITP